MAPSKKAGSTSEEDYKFKLFLMNPSPIKEESDEYTEFTSSAESSVEESRFIEKIEKETDLFSKHRENKISSY